MGVAKTYILRFPMPAARVCLLLAVFSTLSLVALSSPDGYPDGDVQDLGEAADEGRRGKSAATIRRTGQGFATSGMFRFQGFQGNFEEQELGEANSIARKSSRKDPGAPARCESAGGKKKCPIGKWQLYPHKRHPAKRAKSCPDRIGWEGVHFESQKTGGMCKLWTWKQAAIGSIQCERYPCIDIKTGRDIPVTPIGKRGAKQYKMRCPKGSKGRSPFKGYCGKKFCDRRPGARQVCLKMQVRHVNTMSRSAGVFMLKRSSCSADGICAVFKTGLCIDLGWNVWSSSLNTGRRQPGDPVSMDRPGEKPVANQANVFAEHAVALLKKHNNKLPKKHLCSDSRHDNKVQLYGPNGPRNGEVANGGEWTCNRKRCRKHKDATLAHFAILNY